MAKILHNRAARANAADGDIPVQTLPHGLFGPCIGTILSAKE